MNYLKWRKDNFYIKQGLVTHISFIWACPGLWMVLATGYLLCEYGVRHTSIEKFHFLDSNSQISLSHGCWKTLGVVVQNYTIS